MRDILFIIFYVAGELCGILTDIIVLVGAVLYAIFIPGSSNRQDKSL